MLTVTTANVNGIRAAAKKGFREWLAATPADVVCLQEVRAEHDQLPDDLRAPTGWHTLLAPAAAKGRAGVAIYSRIAPVAQRVGFASDEFDTSGRYVEMDFPGLTVGSLYLPAGDVGTPRQEEKERFMTEFHTHLQSLTTQATTTGHQSLICGDWNIAHQEIDLKNWKANQKEAGFLPEERAWLTKVLTETGYTDILRTLHPEGPGPYTWWSNRGQAFANDTGWRIDLALGTLNIAQTARSAVVEKAATYAERWSDHAPVTCVFDWDVAGVPAPRDPVETLESVKTTTAAADS